MAELAETNTYLTDNIIKSSLALENLHNQLKDAGNELKRKQSELDELKNELSSKELNKKVLTTRNTAMREKINEFEGCFQQESESIRQEMKSFFKKLGIKVETNNRDDNLVELQIRFVENLNYSVTLVYDPVTEDYDLFALQPEHPRFRELREMLNRTKDIQGFLCAYRKEVLKSIAN